MVKHREREIEIWPKCLNQNKANTQTAKHKSLLLQDFGFSSKSLYIKNQKTKKRKKKKKKSPCIERELCLKPSEHFPLPNASYMLQRP